MPVKPRPAGFDVDMVDLVMRRILGLNVTWVYFADYVGLYLGIRSGRCHFGSAALDIYPVEEDCIVCPPGAARQLERAGDARVGHPRAPRARALTQCSRTT